MIVYINMLLPTIPIGGVVSKKKYIINYIYYRFPGAFLRPRPARPRPEQSNGNFLLIINPALA